MDRFLATLTVKHDEGLAYVRDFIIRSGEDEIAKYARTLLPEMASEDPAKCLKAHLALLGLLHGWLAVLGDKEVKA